MGRGGRSCSATPGRKNRRQSTARAWLRGESESFRFARRCPNPNRANDQLMRRGLREAAVWQYGPFSPANVVSLLTASAERISKSKAVWLGRYWRVRAVSLETHVP